MANVGVQVDQSGSNNLAGRIDAKADAAALSGLSRDFSALLGETRTLADRLDRVESHTLTPADLDAVEARLMSTSKSEASPLSGDREIAPQPAANASDNFLPSPIRLNQASAGRRPSKNRIRPAKIFRDSASGVSP